MHDACCQGVSQLCDDLVMADVDVVTGEGGGTDATGIDPFGGHCTGGGRLVVAVASEDRGVLGDDGGVGTE